MFINLGRRAKFFLKKPEDKEIIETNQAHVASPQLILTPISSNTPDDRRRKMNQFARLSKLSHEEKAA